MLFKGYSFVTYFELRVYYFGVVEKEPAKKLNWVVRLESVSFRKSF